MSLRRAKAARRVVRASFTDPDHSTQYEPVQRTFRVKEWPVPAGTNADGTPQYRKYITVTFQRTSFCFKSLYRNLYRSNA